jgi:hypothetical protein
VAWTKPREEPRENGPLSFIAVLAVLLGLGGQLTPGRRIPHLLLVQLAVQSGGSHVRNL